MAREYNHSVKLTYSCNVYTRVNVDMQTQARTSACFALQLNLRGLSECLLCLLTVCLTCLAWCQLL